jgi:hypothetical protein
MEIKITEASKKVFLLYAKDAPNWSFQPYVSHGNISPTKQQRGNLSDLVQKGLIKIEIGQVQQEYWTRSGSNWVKDIPAPFVVFTEAGIQYAETLGIDLTWATD